MSKALQVYDKLEGKVVDRDQALQRYQQVCV